MPKTNLQPSKIAWRHWIIGLILALAATFVFALAYLNFDLGFTAGSGPDEDEDGFADASDNCPSVWNGGYFWAQFDGDKECGEEETCQADCKDEDNGGVWCPDLDEAYAGKCVKDDVNADDVCQTRTIHEGLAGPACTYGLFNCGGEDVHFSACLPSDNEDDCVTQENSDGDDIGDVCDLCPDDDSHVFTVATVDFNDGRDGDGETAMAFYTTIPEEGGDYAEECADYENYSGSPEAFLACLADNETVFDVADVCG